MDKYKSPRAATHQRKNIGVIPQSRRRAQDETIIVGALSVYVLAI
jgi:hypothetical protein